MNPRISNIAIILSIVKKGKDIYANCVLLKHNDILERIVSFKCNFGIKLFLEVEINFF